MGRGRGPAGEPSWAAPAHDLAPENSEAALLSKRAIWISAVVAAAIVLGSGLVSQLLTRGGPASKAQPSSVATFVGSKTCAGCHQVEARLWAASQHKAAMQHATDKTGLDQALSGTSETSPPDSDVVSPAAVSLSGSLSGGAWRDAFDHFAPITRL